MSTNDKTLRWGSTILAIGASGIMAAPIAILSRRPDPTTTVGRHIWAGALALACLSILEILIALHPLRKGEKWAFAAAIVPFVGVGFPVLIMDAVYVDRESMIGALAPQILGLGVGLIGLTLSARGIFSKRS
jgi:hypothetical protein